MCLWREANNHSFPSRAEAKDQWNYTSSPPVPSWIRKGNLYLRNFRTFNNLCVNYKKFFFIFFLLAQQPSVCQNLLNHEVSKSHTTTHNSRIDSSGRVISSSQRPLPDKTQHSQQKNIHAPRVGFEPTISAGERPQTYASNCNIQY
jgi:hypothetical protein